MGRIFQRKKGGSFYISYYQPLKRNTVNECVGSSKLRDAVERLHDRESGKKHGEFVESTRNFKAMVAELLDLVRDDYKQNKKKDLYSLERRLDLHLIPFFKNYRAIAVDSAVVSKYITERQAAGAANATINRELSHLSYAYTLGEHRGMVSRSPVIQLLQEKNRRKGFFDEADFQRIYLYLPEHIKPIAELAYITGMRHGEILSLRWEQVDLTASILRLEETKNGDPREIHYGENEALKSMLETQWERRMATQARTRRRIQSLFFHSNGKPIKDFRYSWYKAMEKAGLPKGKRIFHDLRRTAVRNLINAGVSESVAMLISGHNTRSMLDRYNIRDPRATRAALGKVGKNIVLFSCSLNPAGTGEATPFPTSSEAFPTSKLQ